MSILNCYTSKIERQHNGETIQPIFSAKKYKSDSVALGLYDDKLSIKKKMEDMIGGYMRKGEVESAPECEMAQRFRVGCIRIEDAVA